MIGLLTASWVFTLEKIKLNLSFSLPKTKRGDINIKQYSKVAYLDCELHILIMLVQIDIQICVKIKSKF